MINETYKIKTEKADRKMISCKYKEGWLLLKIPSSIDESFTSEVNKIINGFENGVIVGADVTNMSQNQIEMLMRVIGHMEGKGE